ncbi:putative ATP-dependent helicase [Klebsiella phage vB_Kpn_3]|nr:putative ATP-dependent helicase [Klebsiella phage vB_Kpn_3]
MDDRLRIQKDVAEGGPCVLAAAQSIFSEGISLNELSCLIMGSLINNESLIEQLAGRVQRIVDGKLDPIVVDLMIGGTGLRQASGRMAVYRNNGWKTITMTPEKAVQLAKILLAGCPKS